MGFITVVMFPMSCVNHWRPLYWSSYIQRTFAGSWRIGYMQTITPLTPY